MDGHIVRCGMISSCQSAATSEVVKALLDVSLTHVSSVIASTVPDFTFYLYRCRNSVSKYLLFLRDKRI